MPYFGKTCIMEVKAYEVRWTATFRSCFFYNKLIFPFFARLMQLKDEYLSFYFTMIRWNIIVDIYWWAVPLVEDTSRVPAHISVVRELIYCMLGWHSAPYQIAVNWKRKSYCMEWKPICFLSPRPSFCLFSGLLYPPPPEFSSHTLVALKSREE